MTNLEDNLKNLKNIRLSEADRAQMKRNLLAFIQDGEREGALARHIGWREKFARILTPRKFSMPAIIAALVILLSGGTAVAASSSLPGDALYSFKTGVSEKMVAALKASPEAKAEFGLKLAEKRLEEAEKLAVEGKLDTELVTQMEARFDAHEERMQAVIEKLEGSGKTEAAARLSSNMEAMLKAHDEIVARLNAKIEAGEDLVASEVIGGLHSIVKDRLAISKELRIEKEAKIKTEFKAEAAANVKAMAQHKIDVVTQFVAKAEIDGKVSAEAIAQAKADLKAAADLMAEGNAKLSAGANAEAFAKFMAAHREAQEAQKVLRARGELKLDMHNGLMPGSMMKSRIESRAEVKSDNNNDDDGDAKVESKTEVKGEVNLSL